MLDIDRLWDSTSSIIFLHGKIINYFFECKEHAFKNYIKKIK